ncbi:hypothetical protein HBB16_12245 [Pseudonocardia sp. MCCB 268]|nr:hypothetical protein [Pseudonocardia cytotoxica]
MSPLGREVEYLTAPLLIHKYQGDPGQLRPGRVGTGHRDGRRQRRAVSSRALQAAGAAVSALARLKEPG